MNPATAAAPATPNPAPEQNPLTLVMTIKSPQAAQELIGLLTQFDQMPRDKNPINVALDGLKTVHFARFVFLDNNTKLAVITTYDGTFEKYINDFVDHIGDIFNALLQRMTDAPPLPVQQNRDAFLAYVKANDLTCFGTFYSAYPQATVMDIVNNLPEA